MDNETVDSQQRGGFNWDEMRNHVSRASKALDGIGEMSPELLEQIWAQRAAKLAQVPAADAGAKRVELVLVRLGREIYGLDARYVWEIKPLGDITPVPRVPPWVAGVVNRRGRIYSVVNLQCFFNLPAGESSRSPQLLIVETPEMELALQADDVLSIESISVAQIEAATGTVRSLPPEYVRGVARHGMRSGDEGSLVVVLDLPALLADKRLVIHEEVL